MMFSWGANSYGQLGLGHQEDQSSPARVTMVMESPSSVRCITGGGGHTFIMTDTALYSCGCNSKGQLGQGQIQEVTIPQEVKFFSSLKVKKVAGGWDFSVLLTDLGDVYSWGSNAFGQLGRPDVQGYSSIPHQLVGVNNAVDVAAGLRHALAVTDAGNVYCWGAGKKGQLGMLGNGKPPVKIDKPARVSGLPESCRVKSCVAGSYHSAVLTENSEVLFWGCNKYGQATLPPDETTTVLLPHAVSSHHFSHKKVTEIHSGWTHLLACTEDGSVYSWGRNDYGQLGRLSTGTCESVTGGASNQVQSERHHSCSKFDYVPKPVGNLTSPTQLCCGSEHNLAIIEGKLLSWGWNEHGICGHGHEDNIAKPSVVTSLQSQSVLRIGCGAGHSFALCSS